MSEINLSCIDPECELRATSRGYCNVHYQRLRKRGLIEPKPHKEPKPQCTGPDCERDAKTRGYCGKHYQQYLSSGALTPIRKPSPRKNSDGTPKTCSFEGCKNHVSSRGLCDPHYRQDRRGVDLTPVGVIQPCPTPGCGRGMGPTSYRCAYCTSFKARYSLADDDFDALWEPEARLCGNPGCGSTDKLHLDHDHSCCPLKTRGKASCGKCVRGWLCRGCNWALGAMNEDPRKIEGLVQYLQRFTP